MEWPTLVPSSTHSSLEVQRMRQVWGGGGGAWCQGSPAHLLGLEPGEGDGHPCGGPAGGGVQDVGGHGVRVAPAAVTLHTLLHTSIAILLINYIRLRLHPSHRKHQEEKWPERHRLIYWIPPRDPMIATGFLTKLKYLGTPEELVLAETVIF